MEIKEAIRICAEFDKGKLRHLGDDYSQWFTYHKDLNSLIPIWEQLELDWFEFQKNKVWCFMTDETSGWAETIQEAACIATALVIKDLENGKKVD